MSNKKRRIGILDVNGVHGTKCYIVWDSMLQRCYSENENQRIRNHTYDDCKVCDEWLTYSNFEKWFNKNYKEGQQLDKDILFEGNKLYSPETCCFVPSDINTMMITRQTKKSCLPTGVSETKKGKYQVIVKDRVKSKRIGTFDDVFEAFEAYRRHKKQRLKEISYDHYKKGEINQKIYEAILRHEFNEEIILPTKVEEIKRPENADILQMKNGEIINRFATMSEAGRYLGNTKCGDKISLCCRGLKKSYKGYEWKFEEPSS